MIEINNLTECSIKEDLIKQTVKNVLDKEEFSDTAELSIAFLGPGRMRKLNKIYRKKNRVTDVLSFCEKKVTFLKFKIGNLEKVQGLGEIVICPREVKNNAKKLDISFEKELKKVVIHGVLHLLGYDHEKGDQQAQEMQDKEVKYLS